jgi:hypothetical protein
MLPLNMCFQVISRLEVILVCGILANGLKLHSGLVELLDIGELMSSRSQITNSPLPPLSCPAVANLFPFGCRSSEKILAPVKKWRLELDR